MSYHWLKDRKFPNWRCTSKLCRKEVGFLRDTWFAGTHLSLKEVFQLSYFWSRQTHTQDEIRFDMQIPDETTISEKAVVDWKNFFRDVCARYFERHPMKIGGVGSIIEIDETVISKPKYHRGRVTAEEQWYFGGVERGSGRCFLVLVERRNAETLLPIIQAHVFPGSIIISDLWRAYGGIK